MRKVARGDLSADHREHNHSGPTHDYVQQDWYRNRLSLQPNLFEIVHRPGSKHQNADVLSGQSWGTNKENSTAQLPKESHREVSQSLAPQRAWTEKSSGCEEARIST